MKFQVDPVLSNVHERMRMTLIAKKERKRGGIIFKAQTIAEVINKMDAQYSSTESNEIPEVKDKKVQSIVKKNIKAESVNSKVDKMLALNLIKTSDVQWEKRQKFVMPRFVKKTDSP